MTHLHIRGKFRIRRFLCLEDGFPNDLMSAIVDKRSKVSDVFQENIAHLMDHHIQCLSCLKRLHKPAIRFVNLENVPKEVADKRFSSLGWVDKIAGQ